MKRTSVFLLALLASVASFAMSTSKIRQHARFLSDRMAYELDLTPFQYDDVYEINYDFIYAVNRLMDDVVYGYTDAIDSYYAFLDYRNDDLRYVLNSNQYRRFMMADYFYRPIYSTGRDWAFRIYTIYSNSSFFYFDRPSIYHSYAGAHGRSYYRNGYYNNRYTGHEHYNDNYRIYGSGHFDQHRRSDFGANLTHRTYNNNNGHGHGGYTIEPRHNNYNNANQNNRTRDPRYRDNSGNQYSPQINNRPTYDGGRGSSDRGTRYESPTRSTATPSTGNTGHGHQSRGSR